MHAEPSFRPQDGTGSAALWRWGDWTPETSSHRPGSGVEIRFLLFNLCGSACNQGAVHGVVDELADAVMAHLPDLTLLNEACRAQVDRLWTVLTDRGYRGSAAFAATSSETSCPEVGGGRWFGNAVLARAPGVGSPSVLPLPNPQRFTEKRSVLATQHRIAGARVGVFCTHLVPPRPDSALLDQQLGALARIKERLVEQGELFVLGGDLNCRPAQLRRLGFYEGAGEVDNRRQRPTYRRRKIDHLFLAHAGFHSMDARVEPSRSSDHRFLLAWAMMDPPGRSSASG